MAQVGNANAVKVRRVFQVLRDLAAPAGGELRILDLACGEGVYAIEAALRGADVLALDARAERMEEGARAAERLRLSNVRFEQKDVRQVKADSHSRFDVIFFLGILYHLDAPDVFHVLENIHEMCRQMVIIDTHVCLNPRVEVKHKGHVYEGGTYREHGDRDPDSIRRARLLASADNTLSFWFTKKSLIDLLGATGFTSVFECHVPLEAFKPRDRITLVAMKGTPVRVSAYPWVNDKSEEEVESTLRMLEQMKNPQRQAGNGSKRGWIRNVVNRMLRPLGCEIIRV
jgi:SAM-dependent methyltransferase